MSLIDFPTRKLNRLKSLLPKTGTVWCGNCDANKVGVGAERCSVCKRVHGRKRKHRNEL